MTRNSSPWLRRVGRPWRASVLLETALAFATAAAVAWMSADMLRGMWAGSGVAAAAYAVRHRA